jgi:hypothetical protein
MILLPLIASLILLSQYEGGVGAAVLVSSLRCLCLYLCHYLDHYLDHYLGAEQSERLRGIPAVRQQLQMQSQRYVRRERLRGWVGIMEQILD